MKKAWTFMLLCCLGSAFSYENAVATDSQEATSTPVARAGTSDEVFDKLPALQPDRDFHTSDPELERLLGILLRENPDVLAARRTWLSSLERPAQARSLPNPKVELGYFVDSIETRVGPQEYGIALTQPVPWLSKLSTDGERSERLAASLEQAVRHDIPMLGQFLVGRDAKVQSWPHSE